MEPELVERARRGDRAAFETIVRSRTDTVYKASLAILGNEADAADATQDTLLMAWRQIGSLRDPARFDPWLARINLNACRMRLRQIRPRVRWLRPLASLATEPADNRTTPVDDRTADADAFDRAFEQLTGEQRALLVWRHLDGRSIEEIADRLGVPGGTVKSRLFAARRALEAAHAQELA
ncbi:MAG TPA: sigma-70 family RNA polymerase sigma factor [Candidatus Limnocylindrales bacterium]